MKIIPTEGLSFAVEDDNGPLLYLPVQPVIAIEDIAVRPGITARQYIEGLGAKINPLESPSHLTTQDC